MSRITEHARIIVIENNEIRRGTVGKVFEGIGVAIVNFDDGNVEKVRLTDIGIEPVAEPNENDREPTEPSEPVEKSEITITPDEFRNTVTELITDLVFEGTASMMLGKSFTVFSVLLSKRLFKND